MPTTRRMLLKASAGTALVGIWSTKGAAQAFPVRLTRILRDALDAVIPAQGKMPSASQAGAVSYFERRALGDAGFRERTAAFLGQAAFQETPDRTAAIRSIEKAAPQLFAEFRDTVYEAYYTNPAIWKLLGYEFRASRKRGKPPASFDEKMTARVRAMKSLYREVR